VKPFRRGPFAALPERPRRAHPYLEAPAREVTVESAHFGRVKIHVRDWGAGPPLLLIHGLMTTGYSWRYLMEPLGARFNLVIPDLVGCGRSDKPDVPYTQEALATFLGELLRALDLWGCDCVGNSLGGALCMRLALRQPGAFARLCNEHSPGVPLFRLSALGAALSLPGTRSLLAWWIRRAPLKWAHRNVHYYDESLKSLEEAHEYGDPLAAVEGARAFVRYLYETLSPRGFAELVAGLKGEKFPVPLLLLYSRQDPLVPPMIGSKLKELVPEARLDWLDNTSHFAHVDTPELVVPPLLDFFGQKV
jgi:pimeloyl-ACP methyl ester carboxylesterase